MTFKLKNIFAVFVIISLLLGWYVDRQRYKRKLVDQQQFLNAMEHRSVEPIYFFSESIELEATDTDLAALLLYRDLAEAEAMHDIVRAYRKFNSVDYQFHKDQFCKLVRVFLKYRLDCKNFEEFEGKLQEFCLEVPEDKKDFARFLGY